MTITRISRPACSAYARSTPAICKRFEGVERAYAVMAGREIRVMVMNDQIDDAQAIVMSKEIARAIETEATYPGQVRVVVVRETRASDYAR